jgi:hypothetical protein
MFPDLQISAAHVMENSITNEENQILRHVQIAKGNILEERRGVAIVAGKGATK